MAANFEWLVAGLGNPGKYYESNRHNIGWMVCNRLAERYKKQFVSSSRIYAQAPLNIGGIPIVLIMPTTYMNNSGEAVLSASKKYSIPTERLIIVSDEYNFPVGKIHLRSGGGDGGHNGISSIIEEIGTNEFIRLRCGIGRDFEAGGMADYVLSNFKTEEWEQLENMIIMACDSIEYLVKNGLSKSMSAVNSGALWKKAPPPEKEQEEG